MNIPTDIVFFGEDKLPDKFNNLHQDDFSGCDLLFVIGTSLTVQPFPNIIGQLV